MRAARVIERMLSAIPIMLGVAIIVFLVMRVTPGDPIDSMMGKEGQVSQEHIDALRREFNLDKPLLTQLRMFLTGACRGDLGNSLTKSKPVAQMIIERFPATVELSLGAILFALAIGIPVGVISAVKQNSWIDRACMSAAFLGVSMPPFWLGIVLIIVLSVRVNWFAVSGRITYGFEPADIT
ncbi:MAG: ABC transporter permease, partial [Bacillota bacterium]